MGEGGRGNSPAAGPPVTIVTVQLRTHSMHALYLRDLAGSEAVTLHDTREEARSSMIEHIGVGTQNGPRYTLRFCRAFDGAHLAKRSERGGWRIGIGPEVIAGEIDMLPTER